MPPFGELLLRERDADAGVGILTPPQHHPGLVARLVWSELEPGVKGLGVGCLFPQQHGRRFGPGEVVAVSVYPKMAWSFGQSVALFQGRIYVIVSCWP